MKTFAELGIPFPLYEGAVETSRSYRGPGTCALCAQPGHLFGFGIGGYVELACSACGAKTDWHVADGVRACSCGAALVAPPKVEREVRACHACFRAGRAKRTQDTELGMITPELAREGVTHGVPGLAVPGIETEPVPEEPGWRRARVSSELLEELVRTPSYSTWQGERWLFHCGAPMVFVGEWKRRELIERAGGEDAAVVLVGELLGAEARHMGDDFWREFVADEVDVGGLYTFRCARCRTHRAHYDVS